VIRVSGSNRQGTRAALMWLLDNVEKLNDYSLVVVYWHDFNMDGAVQEGEIGILYLRP